MGLFHFFCVIFWKKKCFLFITCIKYDTVLCDTAVTTPTRRIEISRSKIIYYRAMQFSRIWMSVVLRTSTPFYYSYYNIVTYFWLSKKKKKINKKPRKDSVIALNRFVLYFGEPKDFSIVHAKYRMHTINDIEWHIEFHVIGFGWEISLKKFVNFFFCNYAKC